MYTRRDLLGMSLSGFWLQPEGEGSVSLERWWPQMPLPRELWISPPAGDMETGILLESAAGLAARASIKSRDRFPLIYEENGAESYRLAFDAYCKAHQPKLTRLSLDEIIQRLQQAGVVKGYLLYRYDPSVRPLHDDAFFDESANVATSLAPIHGGLVVSERLAERAERLGLSRLMDLRRETERACLENHEKAFSRNVLGTCDPRARHARSLMIALNAFVCSGRGEAYRRGLSRCRPDSPVLGWGCGPEDVQTIASSRAGLYQTATDWCSNLTVFAGEKAGELPSGLRAPRTPHWSTLDWGDGSHFACFMLSDGDNVQWEMANFARGPAGASYYDHPRRGQIPFGWGINAPTLAQLSPRTLEDILTRATSNDGFTLFGGAGYFYPDLYGVDAGKSAACALHAGRLRGYMEMTGIRSLAFNFQDWDCPAALKACETMARRLPGLEGVFAFQYYPYSAGEGAVKWVRGADGDEVPVASCGYCVWAQTGRPRDTTPAGVAALINRLERLGSAAASSERCFSWTLVHAWSSFRRVKGSSDLLAEERDIDQSTTPQGTERGYSPALWTAQRLQPHVRLVTPSEWLMRLRLRSRPRATLALWIGECREAGKVNGALARAERELKSIDRDPLAARRCFESLQTAWKSGLPPERPEML
jgi:hypothetical protein